MKYVIAMNVKNESWWTCSTCSSIDGCNNVNCTGGGYQICDYSADDASGTYYYCYLGCQLPSSFYNDGF